MTTSGLYFFQFPDPFPRFIDPSVPTIPTPAIETIAASPIAAPSGSTKKVSFGVTGSSKQAKGHSEPTAELKIHSQPRVDGVIGQLEVYRSGAVKMRLANGILLDVRLASWYLREINRKMKLIKFQTDSPCNSAVISSTSSISRRKRETFNCLRRSQ